MAKNLLGEVDNVAVVSQLLWEIHDGKRDHVYTALTKLGHDQVARIATVALTQLHSANKHLAAELGITTERALTVLSNTSMEMRQRRDEDESDYDCYD